MKIFKYAATLIIATSLVTACGGGDNGSSLTPGGVGGSGGNNATGQDGQQVIRFGSFTGTSFTPGTVSTNQTVLDAGQSANLSVSFVDQSNRLIAETADVLFNSTCASAGLAEISPSVINSDTGTFSTTYTPRGCDGQDIISAQSSLGGNSYSASVTITAQPAPLGSISFVSASPNLIGLKGAGTLPEQSVVTFKVTNGSGGPVSNQQVEFELDNDTGGVTLSNVTDTTNSEGLVSTTVSSGTVAIPVRVKATADDGTTKSESRSSALAITTGLPDQDSFSLSASTLNIEGWAYDGVETVLTIRAADRFNNPAPDGTAISFQAEGASVDSSCETSSGACSVTLRSQSPKQNGRITVLATAVGEESFSDSNPSNGVFDGIAQESFTDLSEAFRDDDEDGIRDSNEPYIDFNSNGQYDNASTTFEGVLCQADCNPDGDTTISIRENIVIVLSGSSFFITPNPSSLNLDAGVQSVTFNIQDINGQVPPAGTTIEASTDLGTISGPSSYTMSSTNASGPASFIFFVKPPSPKQEPQSGLLFLTVTTPLGNISSTSVSLSQSASP